MSAGCENCFAKRFAARQRKAHLWESDERQVASERSWEQPRRWNRAAEKAGERRRVLCGSMCDVFDPHGPIEARNRLFQLIEETEALDWCLLTKRPHRISEEINQWGAKLPKNAWLGVSVENASTMDRISQLQAGPHDGLKFVSFEPLIGPTFAAGDLQGIDWVIVGGETGRRARPLHPSWVGEIYMGTNGSLGHRAPFFFKHWGEWETPTAAAFPGRAEWLAHELALQQENHRVHLWGDNSMSYRVGKKKAGRLYLGVEHNEVPNG